MSKQEIKEYFQEVMGQAINEIKKQTEIYKDIIKQQASSNAALLK